MYSKNLKDNSTVQILLMQAHLSFLMQFKSVIQLCLHNGEQQLKQSFLEKLTFSYTTTNTNTK